MQIYVRKYREGKTRVKVWGKKLAKRRGEFFKGPYNREGAGGGERGGEGKRGRGRVKRNL